MDTVFQEASGIVQNGASLIIVGDDAHGFYFVRIGDDLAKAETAITSSPLKVFGLADCPAIRFANADKATDLESIELPAGGSYVSVRGPTNPLRQPTQLDRGAVTGRTPSAVSTLAMWL